MINNSLNMTGFSTYKSSMKLPPSITQKSLPSLKEVPGELKSSSPKFSSIKESRTSQISPQSNPPKSVSMANLQKEAAGKVTGNLPGKTGVDEKVFQARKSVLSKEGSVPDSAKTGIATDKINIDGKTVEVGSFNVEWLGSDKMNPREEGDYKKLAGVIKKSGAEVMALQEVSNEKALGKVLKHLPNYDYVMGKSGTYKDGNNQRIAFIYNKDKIECNKSSVTEIEEAKAGHKNLRAPLAAEFKSKDGGFDFTLVGVHLKARMDDKSRAKREAQAEALGGWINNKVANGPDKDVIVVGDYNDFLNSKTTKKLGAGKTLDMTTAEAAARGEVSHHGHYRSLIDHIGITKGKGAAEEYIPNSTYVVKGDSNSDHSPIVASFRNVDNDPAT